MPTDDVPGPPRVDRSGCRPGVADVLDDLAARAAGRLRAEADAELDERVRAERARVGLADLLRGWAGAELRTTVAGLGALRGVVAEAGRDHLLLDVDGVRWALPHAALLAVECARGPADPGPAGPLDARWGLADLLRGWVRDRRPLLAVCVDGATHRGAPAAAGPDVLVLAGGPAGGAGTATTLVPLTALAAVRRWR